MNATSLNFNLTAMAAPKTRQECLALAAEALMEMENISKHLDAAIAACAAQQAETC